MNVRLDVGIDDDEVGNADTGGGGGNDGQNKLAYGNVARTLLAIQAFHIISARLSDGVIRLEFGLSTLVERIDDGGTQEPKAGQESRVVLLLFVESNELRIAGFDIVMIDSAERFKPDDEENNDESDDEIVDVLVTIGGIRQRLSLILDDDSFKL